jgi:pyridoxal phosphate enzyme (YggS family)
METIRKNWENLQERLVRAAERAGRNPREITVVAVTKTRAPAEIEAAIRSGIHIVAENRIQEAEAKKDQVKAAAQWHLVGHLQTNKAKKAVDLFDLVQSVDSIRLATALDTRAAQAGRTLDILLQVNTSGVAHQAGASPDALEDLVGQVTSLSHLRIQGLMTIGALSADESVVRSCFARLRELQDQILTAFMDRVEMKYLSMGMSGDFELAIAEGANMLRLGTTLFGPRPN